MTTVTESDIKELKELIIKQGEQLNKQGEQLNKQGEQLNNIDKRLVVIETRLDEWRPMIQKIPDLTEKIGELKNWKQASLVIITAFVSSVFSGLIGGVMGWLIRGGKI